MSVRKVAGLDNGLRDGLRFFGAWAREPKSVGSVWPTGVRLARKMASVIDLRSGLPVLEIGPGTGTITRAILETGLPRELLWAVEYSKTFADKLRLRFPGVNVVEADAFALERVLPVSQTSQFDCAISALPLLNFPLQSRIALVEDILDRLPPGRPLIQFSYGRKSPVPPGLGTYAVKRLGMVIRNVPPAQLWVYSRAR